MKQGTLNTLKIITLDEFIEMDDRDPGKYIFPFKWDNLPLDTLGVVDFRSFRPVVFSNGALEAVKENFS